MIYPPRSRGRTKREVGKNPQTSSFYYYDSTHSQFLSSAPLPVITRYIALAILSFIFVWAYRSPLSLYPVLSILLQLICANSCCAAVLPILPLTLLFSVWPHLSVSLSVLLNVLFLLSAVVTAKQSEVNSMECVCFKVCVCVCVCVLQLWPSNRCEEKQRRTCAALQGQRPCRVSHYPLSLGQTHTHFHIHTNNSWASCPVRHLSPNNQPTLEEIHTHTQSRNR